MITNCNMYFLGRGNTLNSVSVLKQIIIIFKLKKKIGRGKVTVTTMCGMTDMYYLM